jgi:hypothetical protein
MQFSSIMQGSSSAACPKQKISIGVLFLDIHKMFGPFWLANPVLIGVNYVTDRPTEWQNLININGGLWDFF